MSPTPSRTSQPFHDLRGTLNGLGLQLEVMALAFARTDAAMHERALDAARAAIATLAAQIEALREEVAPA